MVITEIVKGNGDDAPKRLATRIGWFVAIWALSTVAFFVVASLLHLMVPK